MSLDETFAGVAEAPAVDSESVGEASLFLSLDQLRRRFDALPNARQDEGRVTMIVRRTHGGRREVLEQVVLTPESGVPGDAWERRPNRKDEMQIAAMRTDVARLIANTQPLTLFGDNLFLDLDLSSQSLVAGSRLQVGNALLEVTPKPHTGCRKFEARFGADALRFVWLPELAEQRLRGIYMRVVAAGRVLPGDRVTVVRAAGP